MLTVDEYLALTPIRRLGYRLYRHPLVMFGLGPAFVFFLMQRLPIGMMRQGWRPWVSVLGNGVAVLVGLGALVWVFGAAPVLIVNVVTMLLAATIGVWLFYVQHQFEGAQWARNGEWKRDHAALAGSSHYDLPPVLRWFTANIGIHHVHHLSSRIPFYRLSNVLKDHPELRPVSRIGLWESFRCARLALWDEADGRLVSFREARLST
jgi:omega-6 fatty acid desaturase (delta-12 desaturase)